MPNYFAIANRWESPDVTADDRAELKDLITSLVRYPCKLACQPNSGSVDIYVFSERKGRVTDWLELQPSGAIGVIFDEYSDPDCAACMRVNDACEAYNERNGLEFAEESGSSSSSESGASESSASEATETTEEEKS
jgi:hypothetical protein